MATFGLTTGFTPVPRCFNCLDNHLWGFPLLMMPGVAAYAGPGSVRINFGTEEEPEMGLLPFPCTALLVPFEHPTEDKSGGYGINCPDDWAARRRQLLPLLPDLSPGDPVSFHCQVGEAAGARFQGFDPLLYPPHYFEWAVWARDKKLELKFTRILGLATIINESRQRAGSVPTTSEMADVWAPARPQLDGDAELLAALREYHIALGFGPN